MLPDRLTSRRVRRSNFGEDSEYNNDNLDRYYGFYDSIMNTSGSWESSRVLERPNVTGFDTSGASSTRVDGGGGGGSTTSPGSTTSTKSSLAETTGDFSEVEITTTTPDPDEYNVTDTAPNPEVPSAYARKPGFFEKMLKYPGIEIITAKPDPKVVLSFYARNPGLVEVMCKLLGFDMGSSTQKPADGYDVPSTVTATTDTNSTDAVSKMKKILYDYFQRQQDALTYYHDQEVKEERHTYQSFMRTGSSLCRTADNLTLDFIKKRFDTLFASSTRVDGGGGLPRLAKRSVGGGGGGGGSTTSPGSTTSTKSSLAKTMDDFFEVEITTTPSPDDDVPSVYARKPGFVEIIYNYLGIEMSTSTKKPADGHDVPSTVTATTDTNSTEPTGTVSKMKKILYDFFQRQQDALTYYHEHDHSDKDPDISELFIKIGNSLWNKAAPIRSFLWPPELINEVDYVINEFVDRFIEHQSTTERIYYFENGTFTS